jgi:four helix bundle protein
MTAIVSFRDLEVWQRAMDLVTAIYKASDHFPVIERYGLSSQVKRASVSIPSNIAEGHARRDGAFLNHVRIALGSQAEVDTEIELAVRLGFLSADDAKPIQAEIDRVRQMLHGLRRSLEARRKRNVAVGITTIVLCVALLFFG